MKVKLKVSNKAGTKEHTLNLGDIVSVGRSSSCQLRVDDERMSSHHCRFSLAYNRLEITDLDSKNGTYLNGIRIEASEIFLGDKIRVGKTVISVDEADVDNEAAHLLAFAGAAKDRINYELKADFTSVRVQNQRADVSPQIINADASHMREIDYRKKIKSKLTLSKHEIKLRNKGRATLAMGIDVLCLLVVLVVPFILLGRVLSLEKKSYLILIEGLIIVLFTVGNFKLMKFSLGEKLSGIQKLYKDQ